VREGGFVPSGNSSNRQVADSINDRKEPKAPSRGFQSHDSHTTESTTHPTDIDLACIIRKFAARLQRDCATDIVADPPGFKRAVTRLLWSFLPPNPGRPRKPEVTLAVTLRQNGSPWPDIYPQCIPNYSSLLWKERRLKIARLRNAVRGRKRLGQTTVANTPQHSPIH
jgi:hypothetical protein